MAGSLARCQRRTPDTLELLILRLSLVDCQSMGLSLTSVSARLQNAVSKGLVAEKDVSTAAERVLAAQFKLGLFDPPEASPWAHLGSETLGSHLDLAKEVAAKGQGQFCRHPRVSTCVPGCPCMGSGSWDMQ